MKKLNRDEFIERAKKIHGGKYDYSKVEYVTNNIKVCIVCPIHGDFWQTPNSHLNGQGCRKCSNENTSKRCRLSNDEFIEKARKIHGDKYDYSLVDYSRSIDKVKIVCPIHGVFLQKPNYHLDGCGCPKCGEEKHIKHGMTNTHLYGAWSGMIERCYNIKHKKYKNYGGRGIKVCDEWRNSFESFYKWAINNGYMEGLTIERIDVNGNYEPSNCTYITNREQYYNKTNTVFLKMHGNKVPLCKIAYMSGINRETIMYRYRNKGCNGVISLLKSRNKLDVLNDIL